MERITKPPCACIGVQCNIHTEQDVGEEREPKAIGDVALEREPEAIGDEAEGVGEEREPAAIGDEDEVVEEELSPKPPVGEDVEDNKSGIYVLFLKFENQFKYYQSADPLTYNIATRRNKVQEFGQGT